MGTLLGRFRGDRPDFLVMLRDQLLLARRTLETLDDWCRQPTEQAVEQIFSLEKQADAARSHLSRSIPEAFETPLDREDLDDLSRGIDDIVDACRAMVRTGQALKVTPLETVRKMVENLHQGVGELVSALEQLPREPAAAQHHAAHARRPMRINERLYSSGIAELLELEDLKQVLRQMEMYRSAMRLSEVLEGAAGLLDHALNKLN